MKGKFNLLSRGLFNNVYNRSCSSGREEQISSSKDDDDDDNDSDDEIKNKNNPYEKEKLESINTNYEDLERMKKEFNEQLIYSYYSNYGNFKGVDGMKDKNIMDINKNGNRNVNKSGNRNENRNMNRNENRNENRNMNRNENRNMNRNENRNMNRNMNRNENTSANMSMHINSNYDYNSYTNKKDLLTYNNDKQNEERTLYIKNNEQVVKEENVLYNELKKLKNEILALKIMNVSLQKHVLDAHVMSAPKVVPQHIIINNKTEVASNAVNQMENNNNDKKKKNYGFLYLLFKKLLSSRFNQMLFVSSIFISCYLFNKQWQRALKVAQLQKKINSNIILRSVRFLEEAAGIRKVSYI
ncbi:microneme associated antigen [Plasmodium brasilianum]|nr:microneme associated antigen [Plasmodium brasilianum]SBS96088.1 microneme associated antigen, putative [Plasmodium malariae]